MKRLGSTRYFYKFDRSTQLYSIYHFDGTYKFQAQVESFGNIREFLRAKGVM